jgi:hypothetical protein
MEFEDAVVYALENPTADRRRISLPESFLPAPE